MEYTLFNKDSRILTRFHYENDGSLVIQKTVDVEPILDACHETRVLTSGRKTGDSMFAGSVPRDMFGRLLVKAKETGEPVGHLALQWLRDNPKLKATDKRI